MTRKIDIPLADTVITAFADWLLEHTEIVAAELVSHLDEEETVEVGEPSPEYVSQGAAVLAVFTARAAIRKAIRWFQESRSWSEDQKQRFLLMTLTELQDAVQNCNNALYHLNAPHTPGIDQYLTYPDATQGGEA